MRVWGLDMDDNDSALRLLSVSLKSRESLVPVLTALVHRASVEHGLTEEEAVHLEEATEEACLNVIHHAYEGRKDKDYQVHVELPPGKFVVAVEDRGLPFDWEKVGIGESGLGGMLMKAFTDEMRFVNLGSRGKRLELVRRFGHRKQPIDLSEQQSALPEMAPLDAPFEMRQMRPDEAVALERCFYRTYGYTYSDMIYDPEAVLKSMEQGTVEAVVAVTPEGEIVGHVATVKDEASDPVGDLARVVVDPRYRRRAIFDKLAVMDIELARENGMAGLYSEAVTVHPATQKILLKNGGVETGVLLGFIPSSFVFSGISEERGARSPVVLYYLKTNKSPVRTAYLPERHEKILKEIYSALAIERDFRSPSSALVQSGEETELDVSIIPDMSTAKITINKTGKDAASMLKERFRALCLQQIENVNLSLMLSDPGTPAICEFAEDLGFFFGGVVPEIKNGDVLRMQYLNNAESGGSEENIVSPFGKKLYRYVCSCRG